MCSSDLYFANLLINAIFAFADEGISCFSLGLFCFILCDVFVGLSMLHPYLPLTEGTLLYRMAHPGINMAWVFYIPTLTLLGASRR